MVAFEGRLDEARLRRAVRLVMDREPVVGCRYVPAKKPYWERRDDLDSLPVCEVVETAAVHRELERFAARPSDATRDPLVQACIVRGASDTLCLKVNHVPADAGGGKDLLYSIAALYRALEDPAYRPTPNLGDRGMGQLFRRYGWRRSLAGARYRLPRPPQNVWQFPTGDLQDEPPVVVTTFSAMQSARNFFEDSIAAVRGTGRRAILLSSFADSVPDRLPPEVRWFAYVPLRQLLPRSSAILHHGGIGTVAAALAAGIPQLIAPLNFDNPYHGARIAELGVAPC
jgi:hypothetical protein